MNWYQIFYLFCSPFWVNLRCAYMLLIPAMKLGIDNTITLAIIYYGNGASLDSLLITLPDLFEIFATCHKIYF